MSQLFSPLKLREVEFKNRIFVSPMCQYSSVDGMSGARVFFKCENFQKSGAFKVRGAFNALLSLPPEQAARGIVTSSSGNQAAAVSLAAVSIHFPIWFLDRSFPSLL